MKYRTLNELERPYFLTGLNAGKVMAGVRFEGSIFDLMGRNDPNYVGGLWEFIQYENGAKAIVLGTVDDFKIKVPPQMNYWEGEMSPFALSIALNMTLCSYMSFEGGIVGESLGNNYHLLRETLDDECMEAGAIFGFLD